MFATRAENLSLFLSLFTQDDISTRCSQAHSDSPDIFYCKSRSSCRCPTRSIFWKIVSSNKLRTKPVVLYKLFVLEKKIREDISNSFWFVASHSRLTKITKLANTSKCQWLKQEKEKNLRLVRYFFRKFRSRCRWSTRSTVASNKIQAVHCELSRVRKRDSRRGIPKSFIRQELDHQVGKRKMTPFHPNPRK